jgi:hypothetical protein
LDDFSGAERKSLIEELGNVGAWEITFSAAAEEISGSDMFMDTIETAAERVEVREFAASSVNSFVRGVLGEMNVSEESHPIEFNSFGGFSLTSYCRRRG